MRLTLAAGLGLLFSACSVSAEQELADHSTPGIAAEVDSPSIEPTTVPSESSARQPVAARYVLDVPTYATRNGYYLKDGWWWREGGHGVLHALFDEGSHYGVGLMMSADTNEHQSRLALSQMAAVMHDLEFGSKFAIDVVDFYREQLIHYAELDDAEYASSRLLHGREVKVSFWWSENEVGAAAGTLIEIQKP